MTPKRAKQYFLNFDNALGRLESAVIQDLSGNDLVVDAAIRRFKFSYELAWKLAKCVLNCNGIEANNPRSVIKESFKEGMIDGGQEWIDMLEDRNKTLHIYDEAEAVKIYEKIKKVYYPLLEGFHVKIQGLIKEMEI